MKILEKFDPKGFTLVELMITTAVVVTIVVGFLGSTTALRLANEGAYERGIALQDANQVIEQIRTTAASGTFPANVTAVYANGAAVSGFPTLTTEAVTVSYASATADPLDVTVTVSYKENGTRTLTQTLRTYVTQRV